MVNAFCLQVALIVGDQAPHNLTHEQFAVVRTLLRGYIGHVNEPRRLAMESILQSLEQHFTLKGDVSKIIDNINENYKLLSPSVAITKINSRANP